MYVHACRFIIDGVLQSNLLYVRRSGDQIELIGMRTSSTPPNSSGFQARLESVHFYKGFMSMLLMLALTRLHICKFLLIIIISLTILSQKRNSATPVW